MYLPGSEPSQKTVELAELVKTQLFKEVSMAQVGHLLKFCPIQELARGDKLFVPGQHIDKVYVLLQGHLQVFLESNGDTPVAEIKPGECVGLASFVDRQACRVTVVSTCPARLLPIDERRLLTLANSPTVFSRNLLFMLMKYMRDKAARDAAAAAPVAVPAPLPDQSNLIDAITGLHNQRWLDETLDRLTLRSATDCKPLSIVAVDLLQPAELVAEFGQETCNVVMREVAGMLRALIRPTDLLARHNNGRFILMLPETNLEGANNVAARIEESVNASRITIPDGCVLPPTKIVLGSIMMKAFVAGRKLVADAMAAMDKNREILLDNLKAQAAAQAAESAIDSAITPETTASETEQATPESAETMVGDAQASTEYTSILDNSLLSTGDNPATTAISGNLDTLASGATVTADNLVNNDMPQEHTPDLPQQAA